MADIGSMFFPVFAIIVAGFAVVFVVKMMIKKNNESLETTGELSELDAQLLIAAAKQHADDTQDSTSGEGEELVENKAHKKSEKKKI